MEFKGQDVEKLPKTGPDPGMNHGPAGFGSIPQVLPGQTHASTSPRHEGNQSLKLLTLGWPKGAFAICRSLLNCIASQLAAEDTE